ncbi:uncharacterized protein CLUP02_13565 [Colletotrichum lupini]|uniref:Uncharacterized protein n=1 Tax=Colletotrichum lupini TaxID=145971 RepID=A0A9Q8WLJ6_9PEZI|nr:uncharacterized protein CLUP02_13565 [Colletotrichum lupini]UQC88043.1 hypothetical protein CLUP02_13565 [Colletotrichum lupini]
MEIVAFDDHDKPIAAGKAPRQYLWCGALVLYPYRPAGTRLAG